MLGPITKITKMEVKELEDGSWFHELEGRAEEISRLSEDKQHMKIAAERIHYVGVMCKIALQTYIHPHDVGSPTVSVNW
jgi:hypothetical protein